jgi:acetyl-CoA C-acetyltransferase
VEAPRLGAAAIKGVLEAWSIDPKRVDEVFFGNVLSSNLGQAPVTQAAYHAGLPDTVPTTLVNKVCASGLKSAVFAAQSLHLGDAELNIAGGMESMSLAPHFILNYRTGNKYGHTEIRDSVVRDGLSDAYTGSSMGNCGELCARKYEISREEQDAFATQSFQLANAGIQSGKFAGRITPITLADGKTVVTTDEQPGRVKYDRIPTLKPAFQKDGSITAANSSPINDGAAALLLASEQGLKANNLQPLARIVAHADASLAPDWFTIANVDAIRRVLAKAQLTINDIDLMEINEAFAVVVVSNARLLDFDLNKCNIHGGAVAFGHPIGMSGARILLDLAHNLQETGGRYGIAAICNGGGGSTAVLIENLAR